MSRKKQAERYKILYTPMIKRLRSMFLDPTLYVFEWTVAYKVGPPFNDYVPLAGFTNITEAKAYRRKKIKEN